MTDYRDINRPGASSSHRNPYDTQRSGSGVGGIIIAIAVVVIVFLGLSLLSGVDSTNQANAPAAVDTESTTGALPQTQAPDATGTQSAPATDETAPATNETAPATTTD